MYDRLRELDNFVIQVNRTTIYPRSMSKGAHINIHLIIIIIHIHIIIITIFIDTIIAV
jgi:hypothetical protein